MSQQSRPLGIRLVHSRTARRWPLPGFNDAELEAWAQVVGLGMAVNALAEILAGAGNRSGPDFAGTLSHLCDLIAEAAEWVAGAGWPEAGSIEEEHQFMLSHEITIAVGTVPEAAACYAARVPAAARIRVIAAEALRAKASEPAPLPWPGEWA